MSKFVSDKLEHVDCGDGEFVKIPEAIPFSDVQKFKAMMDSPDRSLKMVLAFVKSWNFKDDDGKDVEFNEKNLRRLDLRIAAIIVQKIEKKMTIGKKKSETSDKPSGETEAASNTPIM